MASALRIGMQLDQAILEDILIVSGTDAATPAGQQHALYSMNVWWHGDLGDAHLLNLDDDNEGDTGFDYDSPRSPKQSLLVKGAELLNNYLAEVALDSNILPSKFISLVELLPDHALFFA
jgi:hypothetical protein